MPVAASLSALPPIPVVIFSAPSGAGKTTILHAALRQLPYLQFSVSATTRPPRSKKGDGGVMERDGVDYYFVSEQQFLHDVAQDAFVEWEEVYQGRYYGTLKREIARIAQVGACAVFEVDVMGGVNLKQLFGAQALSIFIQPPSLAVLRARLEARGTEGPDEVARRIAKAEAELAYRERFDRVVVNDKLERAVAEVVAAIEQFTAAYRSGQAHTIAR